jgi:hypothetical protein
VLFRRLSRYTSSVAMDPSLNSWQLKRASGKANGRPDTNLRHQQPQYNNTLLVERAFNLRITSLGS